MCTRLCTARKPFQYVEISRDQRGFMYAGKVTRRGRPVGVATSRGSSYYFRQMLSLCVIDVDCSEVRTDVTVVWGEPGEPQKEIRALLAAAPYKKDNRRIDLRNQ
jgi:vanillate/3-O-methylgallate O-demethylase